MANNRSQLPSRSAAFLTAVLAILVGSALLAAPAAAQPDTSVPTWGIKSVGATVATRDALKIDDVVLSIGFVGTQQIKFQFELQDCCEFGTTRARFTGGQAGTACTTIGALPTATIECTYTREIPASKDEEFSFSFPISRPAPQGRPSVRMTVFLGEQSSLSRVLTAERVKPESDFVVTAQEPQGRVGDIVTFDWKLTNVGLDAVWERSGMVEITAPPGTEFTDWDAVVADPGIICFAPSATPTFRQCWFPVTEPGQANAHRRTWKLKIVSEQVGEGKIIAKMSNSSGAKPEGDFVDPTPDNNTAVLRVKVLTDADAPAGGQTQLPITGTQTGLMIGAGLAVVVAGGLLVLVFRRRRPTAG